MRKIFTFVLAVALFFSASGSAFAARSGSGAIAKQTIDTACMAAAVQTREMAVLSAFESRTAAIKTALETRSKAIASSWSLAIAKERKTAREAAVKAFNAAVKTARAAYAESVRSVWKSYKTAAAACSDRSEATSGDALAATADAQM